MPSLRENPQKKRVFEQEAIRPAKKLRTEKTSPQSADRKIQSPFNDTVTSDHVAIPQINRTMSWTPHVAPKLGTFTRTSSSASTSIRPEIIISAHSSVPSLITEADATSDCSTSSTLETPKSGIMRPLLSGSNKEGGKSQKLDDTRQAGSFPPLAPNSFQSPRGVEVNGAPDDTRSNFIRTSSTKLSDFRTDNVDAMSAVLHRTYDILNEMEAGQPFGPFTGPKGWQPLDKLGPSHRHSPSDARSTGRSMPTMETTPDAAIASIISGIIAELHKGRDLGYGLARLDQRIASYQLANSQRFITVLNDMLDHSCFKVNLFLGAEEARALQAIYKLLERRLTAPDPPAPTPPPGYMVVKSDMLPMYQLSANQLTGSSPHGVHTVRPEYHTLLPAPVVLPSNAPHMPAIAPKSSRAIDDLSADRAPTLQSDVPSSSLSQRPRINEELNPYQVFPVQSKPAPTKPERDAAKARLDKRLKEWFAPPSHTNNFHANAPSGSLLGDMYRPISKSEAVAAKKRLNRNLKKYSSKR